MLYSRFASSISPALIIFLLDLSASMYKPEDNGTARTDLMIEGMRKIIKRAIWRSARGEKLQKRYLFAAYGYSNEAYCVDIWRGVNEIDEIARIGFPIRFTQPKAMCFGFRMIRDFLHDYMPQANANSPAPILIHFTDGEIAPGMTDPFPFAKEIMQLSSIDGPMLIENILCTRKYSIEDIGNSVNNPGRNEEIDQLISLSSVLPESFRAELNKYLDLRIQPSTPLLFPVEWKGWEEIFARPIIS